MAAPMTIAAIHEQATEEKLAQEKEAFTRQISPWWFKVSPDSWAVAGGAAPQPPPNAGNLSKFGKIGKSAPMMLGPSSVFQKGFTEHVLDVQRQPGDGCGSRWQAEPSAKLQELHRPWTWWCPRWRCPSPTEMSPTSAPLGPSRRQVEVYYSCYSTSTVGSEVEGDEDPTGTPSLSEADAKNRSDEDSKEFFSIRDLSEAEVYFTKLPSDHRHLLVDKLVTKAVELKQADAQLVADLFERAMSHNICSPASFEEGFMPTAEIIDDVVIDALKAMDLFAMMIKNMHLHLDEGRYTIGDQFDRQRQAGCSPVIGCRYIVNGSYLSGCVVW